MSGDRSEAATARRPRGRPNRISRDQIVEATLGMLASEGLEAFSMARLASRMKASPMALYTYFPGRDALLDAAAETIFSEFDMPERGGGWEAASRRWLDGIDRLFDRWPVALRLIKWEEHISPSWLRVWLPMMYILHDAGLRGERLSLASSWFGNMTMSLLVGRIRQPSGAAIESFLEAASPQDRRFVEETIRHLGPDSRGKVFDHGVEAIIGALGRLIERERSSGSASSGPSPEPDGTFRTFNRSCSGGYVMDHEKIDDAKPDQSDKTPPTSDGEASAADGSSEEADALEADVKRDHLPHVGATG